jgi:hypothetical protein
MNVKINLFDFTKGSVFIVRGVELKCRYCVKFKTVLIYFI